MKSLSIPVLVLSATSAAADPGHLAEVAGHSHWIAVAALGAAAAVAIAIAIAGRKRGSEEAEQSDEAGETAETADTTQ